MDLRPKEKEGDILETAVTVEEQEGRERRGGRGREGGRRGKGSIQRQELKFLVLSVFLPGHPSRCRL